MGTLDSVVYKGFTELLVLLESDSIVLGFYFIRYLNPLWWVGEREE